MRYLLDTHVWLLLQTAPEQVPPLTLERLEDPEHALVLSAASAWEIAIKYALAKLPLPEPPDEYVPSRMRAHAVEGLPVTHSHALRVATLPHHHRDPFDRLLVAQAQHEDLVLVTRDPAIHLYDVETLEG